MYVFQAFIHSKKWLYRPHNPETAGLSPVFATINPLKSFDFRGFLLSPRFQAVFEETAYFKKAVFQFGRCCKIL